MPDLNTLGGVSASPTRRARRRAASCTGPQAWPSGPHCAPGTAGHSSHERAQGRSSAASSQRSGATDHYTAGCRTLCATHPHERVVLVCCVLHALLVACQSAVPRAACAAPANRRCCRSNSNARPCPPRARTAEAGALRRRRVLQALQEPEHGGLAALVRAQRAAHHHQPAVHVAPGLGGQHAPRARPCRRRERLQARLVDPVLPARAGLAGHAVGVVLRGGAPPRELLPDSRQPRHELLAGARARTTTASRPSWKVRVQEHLALTLVTDSVPPFCRTTSVDWLPYLIAHFRTTQGKPSSCVGVTRHRRGPLPRPRRKHAWECASHLPPAP